MEQVTGFINEILLSWGFSQSWADDLTSGIILVVILAIAFLGDAICRHIILTAVARLVKKTKATWDDIVFDRSADFAIYIVAVGDIQFGAVKFHTAYLHDLYHCCISEVYQFFIDCAFSCI